MTNATPILASSEDMALAADLIDTYVDRAPGMNRLPARIR